MDVNMIIANNILSVLREKGKKQMELADGIGVSKQTMSKMLNGARSINAIEMKHIADYLGVSMDKLMTIPDQSLEQDVIHTFMGKVETDEAREAIRMADKVSDMILFHKRVRVNGISMMMPVEE